MMNGELHRREPNAGLTWVWVVAWGVFVLIAVTVLSIIFWCWLSDGESGSTTIRNLGLVVAAIIGLPLAVWRSIVAARQATTAQRGLLNERYQKGEEMLGSEGFSVRLGGIYALARLAREHPGDYHTQIMSLLCAFVRNPPVVENQDTYRREDVQAIMAAVCARSRPQIEIEKKEYCPLGFTGADLNGVNFLEAGAKHFDRLSGKLPPANMEDALLKDANLEGAVLISSNLDEAHLDSANLEGASLLGATLRGSNLTESDLSAADLRKCKTLTQEQVGVTSRNGNNRTLSDSRRLWRCGVEVCLNRTDMTPRTLRGADKVGVVA